MKSFGHVVEGPGSTVAGGVGNEGLGGLKSEECRWCC